MAGTTFLELIAPPPGDVPQAPITGVAISIERPDYDEYMMLWRSIGKYVDWDLRNLTPIIEVKSVLKSESTQIYIARHHGAAVGLCEFYEDEPLHGEIVYFGIVPAMQRQRLGRFLIDAALRHYWSARKPRRVWLHTDTSDDPRALRLYLRVGFRIFATLELSDSTTEHGYRVAIRQFAATNGISLRNDDS